MMIINASNIIFLMFLSTTSGKDISINPRIRVQRHMFIIVAVNSILNENFKNILINKMTNDAIAIKLPYVAIFVTRLF